MPTLEQMAENIAVKIKKYGKHAHCNQLVVSEESRRNAIENRPDETGRQKTRIGLETYSPESYSNFNAAIEYLMERAAFNPVLVIDLILLLIQEARQQTEGEDVDGISIALGALFKINGDYEVKIREAKTEWRRKRLARKAR